MKDGRRNAAAWLEVVDEILIGMAAWNPRDSDSSVVPL
jgi:hypothetical protein